MIRRNTRRVLAVTAVAVGALLVPAGAALAQDDTYPTPCPQGQVVGSQSCPTPSSVGGSSTDLNTGSGTTSDPGDPGTLPVTGGQLAGLTLAGLGVTGAGVALLVLARRPRRARTQA